MVRTISSNEAKQHWGALIGSVSNEGDIVVVESHGKPKVAMIPADDIGAFMDFKEKQRRLGLLEEFRALSAQIGDRNKDLTEEQIDELANRFSREFILDLAREGKIKFEEGLSYYDSVSDK